MQTASLKDLPDIVMRMLKRENCVPIIIFWNNDIMFQEVYRALRFRIRADIGNVQERPGAAAFFVDDYPAIRFFRDPEFSRGFMAKSIIDVSIYEDSLKKYLVNEERQIAIEALAAQFNATVLRTYI